MSKKYPKSEAIPDAEIANEEAYVTWGDDLQSKQEALKNAPSKDSDYFKVPKFINK